MDLLFAFALLFIQWTANDSSRTTLPITEVAPAESVFAMSTDAGLTWQDLAVPSAGDELPSSLGADADQLYIGTGTGLYTGAARLPMQWRPVKDAPRHIFQVFPGKAGPYVTGDGGGFMQLDESTGRWMPMSRQLPDNMVITVHETRTGNLIVGCDSGIYVSTDKGATWTHTLKAGQVYQLVEDGTTLLACRRGGLWRSVDDGRTWSPLSTNGPSTFHIAHVPEGIVAIHNGTEFAGVQMANTVSLSTDQGKTWKPLFTKLPESLKDIHDLTRVGRHWIAVAKAGVFRSADNGATWQNVLVPPAGKGGYFRLVTSGDNLFAIIVNGC
jgi:photosystem II stability/assembly factor-like uncharacterized protein